MNNNRILMEWLDSNGNKVNLNNKTSSQQANEKLVYVWDMYTFPEDKGNWMSAEECHGEWEGFVYESEFEAIKGGRTHLRELEDEGELRGTLDDYNIDTIQVPISKVSKATLRFSGL
jgi:hypothetical protein